MIYSVHGYYGKYGSRKRPAKIEAIVFASSESHAEKLVKELFSAYPVYFDSFSVIHGAETDLKKIYEQRPELIGISPEKGYVYEEFTHSYTIRKYFGK